MASKPAFCSPLKGVAAGAEALPQTRCSSAGELNQKPTLKVWTGENGSAGFSTNVSLSKMPTTLISATPAALLSISDWYQPKPKPLNPASRGECSTRNTSKPVFGGNPEACSLSVSLSAWVAKRFLTVTLATACWMAGQANGLPASRPGLMPSWNEQTAPVHGTAAAGWACADDGDAALSGSAISVATRAINKTRDWIQLL